MPCVTPDLRTAAERLLTLEYKSGGPVNGKLQAGNVTARFRRGLGTLMGAAGYHALISRALTLAKQDAPGLGPVTVHADGTLDGLDAGGSAHATGEAVVVAHLLGLLVTFLGEALMLRLVNELWPKAHVDDHDFHKGDW